MIGRLTGKVIAHDGDGSLVIDVNGVGYELAAPMGTLGRVRVDDGGRVTLWVHTHVREDALSLFGFADEGERVAFRALLGVSNVGPKIAVAILGPSARDGSTNAFTGPLPFPFRDHCAQSETDHHRGGMAEDPLHLAGS